MNLSGSDRSDSSLVMHVLGRASLVLTFAALTTAGLPSSVAHAAGVPPAQATPVQREQAQARFLRGKERYAKKDYDTAVTELRSSLDIVASPNTRLYVGRALREMGRIVEAYVEFGRTEVEAKELMRDDARYEKAGQAAREERLQLEPKLGFVNVDIQHYEDTTTLKVGGDEVRRGGWNEPIPVLPGGADIVVETPGRAPIQRHIEIKATERQSIAIDAAEGAPVTAPAPPVVVETTPNAGLRNVAYIAGGAAVVGLGLFAFFGLKANSTYDDLDTACSGRPCPAGHDSEIAEGKTQQTVANIGLAVFVVGAAAAVTLWVVSSPKKKTATSASAVLGPGFVGLRGAF
jgi:hypothetical protein